MRLRGGPGALLNLAILRIAALLVPGPERSQWFAEWRAELWYVKGSRTLFCLGAFRDALWLRRNTPPAIHSFGLESPVRCISVLATLAAVSMFFAFRLPFPRDMLLPSPYPDARNLAMISADGRHSMDVPTVSIEQYRSLENLVPYRFSRLAFYSPLRMRVQTAAHRSAPLSIAMASADLFKMLQIPIAPSARNNDVSQLLLSQAAWRKYFDADPRIVGRSLEVAGQSAVVAGVILANSWRLPGRMDAWLLQAEPNLAALPPQSKGFVLGRIRNYPSAPPPDPRWRLSVPNPRGLYDRFECSSLVQENFVLGYLCMSLVAVLVVSATTTLALGEYPASSHSRAGVMRNARWVFLALKIALLLPLVCCGTLDLAPVIGEGFEAHGLLVGTVVALRWAIIDQRRRCPVCLRLLTSPTRIGQPSQTFLEWYGTEFICEEGHGLLHVPEIPTISFSPQRWLYLDPSWQSVFRGGKA